MVLQNKEANSVAYTKTSMSNKTEDMGKRRYIHLLIAKRRQEIREGSVIR